MSMRLVDSSRREAPSGRCARSVAFRTIDELRTTVVAVKERVPVMLGDIADVLEAPAVRRGVAHRLAGEVVSCRVVKQFGADTVTVAAAVREALADIGKSLPEGVTLRMVYDQSDLVGSALGGVSRAILIGAGLVVIVLFVLLGNWRAALLVTFTLPLTIALSGLLLARWRHRHQHDDPRWPRDRRGPARGCRDHRHRKHRASPAAASD